MNHTTSDDSPTHSSFGASERLFLSARAVSPGQRGRGARLFLTLTITLTLAFGTLINLRPNLASAGGYAPGEVLIVTTDALNLRADPGLNGSILTVLPYGSPLVVRTGPTAAGGYAWYQVESPIDGTEADYILGWVAADYIAPSGTSGGGNSGYQPSTTVVVSTDALNLRASASLGGAVLDVLPGGAYATILAGPFDGDGHLWYQLDSYGTIGYAAADFLSLASSGGSYSTGSTAIVDTPVLNLRSGPGLANAPIATLSGGTTVTILDGPVAADGYSWYNVDTATHGLGWVCGECLRTN